MDIAKISRDRDEGVAALAEVQRARLKIESQAESARAALSMVFYFIFIILPDAPRSATSRRDARHCATARRAGALRAPPLDLTSLYPPPLCGCPIATSRSNFDVDGADAQSPTHRQPPSIFSPGHDAKLTDLIKRSRDELSKAQLRVEALSGR
jgi:hypothetical protein